MFNIKTPASQKLRRVFYYCQFAPLVSSSVFQRSDSVVEKSAVLSLSKYIENGFKQRNSQPGLDINLKSAVASFKSTRPDNGHSNPKSLIPNS